MICSKCRHCGLCEGDGTFAYDKNISVEQNVLTSAEFNNISAECTQTNEYNESDIGIAFDIGTTTIAAAVFTLQNGKLLFTTGEKNLQSEFGADVIARLSFDSAKEGYDTLHKIIRIQINDIVRKTLARLTAENLSERKQLPVLKKIVIAGNTVMESLAYGEDVSSLGTYPFTVKNKFGITVSAERLFNKNSSIPADCEIFFAPVVSAFVGGDSVCAITSCIKQSEDSFESKSILLADLGTNCELVLYDAYSKKITCTSAAAGPAFECQGIECGMRCSEGAIVSTEYIKETDSFKLKTAGGNNKDGVKPQGICGTGLVSAVAESIRNDLLTEEGAINQEIISAKDKIILVKESEGQSQKEIYISQKDIRNFQLAKGAVKAGIEILLEKQNESSLKEINLFIAGGFGTSLNINDLRTIRMLPEESECNGIKILNAYSAGNASLSGASLMLLSEKIKKESINLSQKVVNIDLAQYPDFQNKFISSLNF